MAVIALINIYKIFEAYHMPTRNFSTWGLFKEEKLSKDI